MPSGVVMKLVVADEQVIASFDPYIDPADVGRKELFKELRILRYDKHTGLWSKKYSPEVLLDLVEMMGVDSFTTNKATKTLIEDLHNLDKVRRNRRKEFLRHKAAKTIDLEGYRIDVPPIGEHQSHALTLFKHTSVLGLFAAAGLGKTWILLHWLRYLNDHVFGGEVRALVLAPAATLFLAWVDDAAKFTPELKCLVLNKSLEASTKLVQADTSSNLILSNFEKLSRKHARLEQALADREFNVLIVDESKKIANYKSAMTKAVLELSKGIEYKAVASAMPAPNSELEYWSQMMCLSPRIFGTSFSAHRKQYFIPTGFQGYTFIPNPALDETRKKKIAEYCVVFKAEDCLDLPPMLHHPLKVILPQAVMQKYREYHDHQVMQLKLEGVKPEVWHSRNTLTRLLRLREIAGGFIMERSERFDETKNRVVPTETVRRLHEEKALAVRGLIENLPRGEQVLVWAQFREEFRILKEMIPDIALAYGETPAKEREKYAADFKEGNLRLLAAHPQTYKYGLTWVKCHYVVWYSLDWSLDSLYQANKRTHRFGQDLPVHYYYLLAYSLNNSPTIDQVMLDRLQEKYTNQEQMLKAFMELSYSED
jgi:hypothetical protein